MRAFALDEFGQPGSIHDLPTPQPGAGEVRVRVAAASLNAFDAFVVSGMGKGMLQFEFPLVPGSDFAGVVDGVGPDVGLGIGRRVFGAATKPVQGRGTLAEYVVVPVAAAAATPDAIDDIAAATLSLAGRTALAVADSINCRPGQTALVVGATGGVGSFATQLLAQRGVRVIASVRPANADYARSLGAIEVIDYTSGDLIEQVLAAHPDGVDAIADFASDETGLTRLASVCRPGSSVVSPIRAANQELLRERGLEAANIAAVGLERQHELADLVVAGALRPPEIRTFPLEQAGDAMSEQASRHVRGKLVVTIA
jgi:NADPH:quinone reductase-like Zn-dependent oxidoreductase